MDALKEVKLTLNVAHIQLDECADALRSAECQRIFEMQSQVVDLMNKIDALTYKEAS